VIRSHEARLQATPLRGDKGVRLQVGLSATELQALLGAAAGRAAIVKHRPRASRVDVVLRRSASNAEQLRAYAVATDLARRADAAADSGDGKVRCCPTSVRPMCQWRQHVSAPRLGMPQRTGGCFCERAEPCWLEACRESFLDRSAESCLSALLSMA
jgi:hypothetical protein